MDILFICRDALGSSIVTNLALAIEAKESGSDVGVLFTEEALAAVSGGVFRWPPELTGQEMRYKMADNSAGAGLSTKGGRGDGRQIDVLASVTKAKEGGITMFACPTWVTLLGLSGKLPEGISEVSLADELKMVKEAKTIIGSF